MSHKGLNERVLIEVARTMGDCWGIPRNYNHLQRELRQFRYRTLAEVVELADDFETLQYISNSQAAHLYHEKGYARDRLNPLQRFLRSHVGEEWNSVINAIRRVVKGRGDSVRHVLDHVYDYVEIHPRFFDGVAHHDYTYWNGAEPISSGDFYVDKGILQEVPPLVHLKDKWKAEHYPAQKWVFCRTKWYFLCEDDRTQKLGGEFIVGKWYRLDKVERVVSPRRLVLNEEGGPTFTAWGEVLTERFIAQSFYEAASEASREEVRLIEDTLAGKLHSDHKSFVNVASARR